MTQDAHQSRPVTYPPHVVALCLADLG